MIFDVYHPDLSTSEVRALAELTADSNPYSYYFDYIERGRSPDWVYDSPRAPGSDDAW